MQLDCRAMTGIIHNCPNLSECLDNSPLDRREAIRLYLLNQGKKPDDLKVNEQPFLISRPVYQPCSYRPPFIYNPDHDTRDTILFGCLIEWENVMGGLNRFQDLTVEKLELLVNQNFANPLETQNLSPTIEAFIEFARQQTSKGFEFVFEGYAISPYRADYRVSIEGMVYHGICSDELILEFQEFVGEPDEVDINPDYLRAWWD